MLELKFRLRNQSISLQNKGALIASLSYKYLVATFIYDSQDQQEAGNTVTAIFKTSDNQIYTKIVGEDEGLEKNQCYVPWEVLQNAGYFTVSAFTGNMQTANSVKVKVLESGYIQGETPYPPSDDVYNQIINKLNKLESVTTISGGELGDGFK